MAASEQQLRLQFTTHVERYALDETFQKNVFDLPDKLNRFGLSQVVNHLLHLDAPVPFQFVIGGVLLRTSLRKHLKSIGASTEEVIVAEYQPAVQQPTQDTSSAHPDWVACVAGVEAAFITGCYDGVLRLHSTASSTPVAAAVVAHAKPVTCVHMAATVDGAAVVASGSKDCTLKVWQSALPAAGADGASAARLQCTAVGHGHGNSVQAVQLAPSGEHVASGAWDGSVKVWALPDATGDGAAAAGAGAGTAAGDADSGKRRRRRRRSSAGEDDAAATAAAASAADLSVVLSLSRPDCVTSAVWLGDRKLAVGGNDHTIAMFDVEAGGTLVQTLPGSKVITSVAASPEAGPSVLVTAHPDHVLRLWDSRESSRSVLAATMKSHTGWVTAVAWSPDSPHLVASASHDTTVRLWDVRSTSALFTAGSHDDKALAVGFAGAGTLVSGGADSVAKVFRNPAAGGDAADTDGDD